ncbi:MAG: AraC family transcriptional regulator [Clostridiales bacterium]|nr:AraC family transcriptional regulator [Clostridiales bacterium]
MRINDIINVIPNTLVTGKELLQKEVRGGYCGDLLSRVMAKGPKDGLWITVQTHVNIIAVAVLLEISCIIIPEDIPIEPNTIEKADEEGIVILSSPLSAFEIAGRLHGMGMDG